MGLFMGLSFNNLSWHFFRCLDFCVDSIISKRGIRLHKKTSKSNEMGPIGGTSEPITKSDLKIQMAEVKSELMKALRKEIQSEMLRLKKQDC